MYVCVKVLFELDVSMGSIMYSSTTGVCTVAQVPTIPPPPSPRLNTSLLTSLAQTIHKHTPQAWRQCRTCKLVGDQV